jgi:hypothetical protein
VHGPAFTVAVPGLLGEQLREHHVEARPLRHGMTVPAVGAGDHVLRGEVGHHPRGDRLLPHVQVEEAGELPLLEQVGRRLLEIPDGDHLAIQVEQERFIQRFHASPHNRNFPFQPPGWRNQD